MTNISSKELTALEDQLGAEQTLIAKYRTFSTACNDVTLKSKYNQIADKHQQHFNTLLNYLQ